MGNVVADQDYLRSCSGIIHRMGILDKNFNVQIIHSYQFPKGFHKVIDHINICLVVTPRVFLVKWVNTYGSSIFTVDKTWCKLMVRLLLLFHLKICKLVTSLILVNGLRYTSLDGLSHCEWSVPVSQVMDSGTKWLTITVFPHNVTSNFYDLLDLPNL